MPWASAHEEAGVDKGGLLAGSPERDVEVKVTDCHNSDACQGSGSLRRRHDGLKEAPSVKARDCPQRMKRNRSFITDLKGTGDGKKCRFCNLHP